MKNEPTVFDRLYRPPGTTAAKRPSSWIGTLQQTLGYHPDDNGIN